jgi:hypothetical protein
VQASNSEQGGLVVCTRFPIEYEGIKLYAGRQTTVSISVKQRVSKSQKRVARPVRQDARYLACFLRFGRKNRKQCVTAQRQRWLSAASRNPDASDRGAANFTCRRIGRESFIIGGRANADD